MTSTPVPHLHTQQSAQQGAFDALKQQCAKIMGELQARWRCKLHSKDKDIYCWNLTESSVCYVLTISNLGFWAVDIVSP
jgi:hypothetical protein